VPVFAPERKIASGRWFGCIDRAAVEKIAAYRVQGDTAAATTSTPEAPTT
jgi:hypothetical protein